MPERRPAWARPGWFDGAAAWIRARLAERGTAVVAPLEQVRSWSLSCVLRAPTERGAAYFKAAADPPLFAHEPRVVAALAARYPAHIPTPLAVDAGRRWLLLPDLGPALGGNAPAAAYATALRAFGRLQIATAADPGWLLAIGCVDRRLDHLAAQIPALLADTAFLASLSGAEVARLRRDAPALAACCAALATYRLPPALVHGDLHGGNIAAPGGTPSFFDWTDASVSHPFFDLPILLPGEDDAAESRLRDAYLALWTAYEPPDRLRAAWALARPLGALHHAISYRSLLGSLEACSTPELADDAVFWLRRLLRWLPNDAPAIA